MQIPHPFATTTPPGSQGRPDEKSTCRGCASNWLRTPATAAQFYLSQGLSPFPCKADSSKEPRFRGWREAARIRPTAERVRSWFNVVPTAIGIAGGAASGNLIILDVEGREPDIWERWCRRLGPGDEGWLASCPVVLTPSGGRHVYVRLSVSTPGAKYARDEAGNCLIEARGNQHYVLAPGSPASSHLTGREYQFEKLGWLDGRPSEPVPIEVWNEWALHACALNRYTRPTRVIGERSQDGPQAVGDRPGDVFNRDARWDDILTPHGWRLFRPHGNVDYWTRPGKSDGVSASTGYCRGEISGDLLWIWSTSAAPFEGDTGYSRFAAYALLNHGGDWSSATRTLARAGYGQNPRRRFK